MRQSFGLGTAALLLPGLLAALAFHMPATQGQSQHPGPFDC
jgi:hypothetical protein